MRLEIKNARFNPKLICWFAPQYENGSYILAIQCMGCEVQLITYGTKEARDVDYKKLCDLK